MGVARVFATLCRVLLSERPEPFPLIRCVLRGCGRGLSKPLSLGGGPTRGPRAPARPRRCLGWRSTPVASGCAGLGSGSGSAPGRDPRPGRWPGVRAFTPTVDSRSFASEGGSRGVLRAETHAWLRARKSMSRRTHASTIYICALDWLEFHSCCESH